MSNHEPFVPWMHSLLDRMKELYNKPNARTIAEALPDIAGAFHYKGTKAAVADLPSSGNATGDVWHITADGSEWAWDGSDWQDLGGAVDLSAYRTAAAQDLIDSAQDNAIAAKYTKPDGGIPKADLADDVQTSLGKADTALQAAPVTSVNGKTGAAVLNANDVGALPNDTPIPAAVTEQTVSGWGFTKNTGTYSKPASGIPKSDLVSAVQTSLGKADTALQSVPSGYATETWVTNKGYQTAAQVQTAISSVRQLPAVSADDNGKFLRVVSGAWAAATVPSAETASF